MSNPGNPTQSLRCQADAVSYSGRSHFELAATLLAHALSLSNHAATLVASLGSYETLASTSTPALAAHDTTLNSAAEMFCRAAGVLAHLADVVIPRWEAAVGDDGLKGRPVEFGRDVVTGLSKSVEAGAGITFRC